jgi:deoxyhypusine synthase
VVYADSTIAAPLLTAYALKRARARRLKRLYDRRVELVGKLKAAFLAEEERKKRNPG